MIRKRYGRIINMVSVSALMGTPSQCNYAASKGGVVSMTRSISKELARYKILVNAVAPGFIETEMLNKMDEKMKNNFENQIPLGRFGAAEEVANLVEFLASNRNSYITGQILTIDGGLSA